MPFRIKFLFRIDDIFSLTETNRILKKFRYKPYVYHYFFHITQVDNEYWRQFVKPNNTILFIIFQSKTLLPPLPPQPLQPSTHQKTNYSRSEEHTSELQSRPHLVCRLLLEKKKNNNI